MENLWKILYRDRDGDEHESGEMELVVARAIFRDYEDTYPMAMLVNAASGESYY